LKGSHTMITVAHRLSTVQACDRILILDGGRIVASGTYQDLYENNDGFRRMVGTRDSEV
jgi:ABC-type multidrug transport system fused ATPase/permease subunit